MHHVAEFLLGVIGVSEGSFDISINTEIWHHIVDWMSLWWLEASSELVLKIFLSLLEVGLSGLNVGINAEVWNIVVNWVSLWLLK